MALKQLSLPPVRLTLPLAQIVDSLDKQDFVLLNSSLETLLPLLTISTKVYNRQRLNLLWAIIFNVICLPFAAGVFYPAHQVRLTPVWSAVLMALSSVSVVCSSLALRW